MRILIVEDNALMGTGLQSALRTFGFYVAWVRDGESALIGLARETFLAMVLDLGLPGMSGMELLQQVRASGKKIPVLILTARDSTQDKVSGLNSGADDFLSKDTNIEELVVRLHDLIRRSKQDGTYTCGDFTLSMTARTARHKGEFLNLTKREFDLLSVLIANAGKVVTRRILEQAVYGTDRLVESNSIEVHIHNLRAKITFLTLKSIRGVGYSLSQKA
jgi:two-component system OmpR family response regulator/two-component system response regulator QseB